MFSKPPAETGASQKQELPAILPKWEKIQQSLAEVLLTNLSLFRYGRYLIPPSQVTAFCRDLARYENPNPSVPACSIAACQAFLERQERFYACPHGFSFAAMRFSGTDAILIAGPFYLGKREDEKTARERSETLKIDPELFRDRIREIKVFSRVGIQKVMDFSASVIQNLA